MKYEIAPNFNCDFTSLQGYVQTTYAKLVEVFGEPTYPHPGDKTTVEWSLRVEDESGKVFPVTIYDYLMDSTPTHEYHWHIGGKSQLAVIFVEDMLAGR